MCTVAIFDQLQPVVECCEPAPGREIELAVRYAGRAGVTKADFLSVYQTLNNAECWTEKLPVAVSRDYFFDDKTLRGTMYTDGREPVLIEKIREKQCVLGHASGMQLVVNAKRERLLKTKYENWPQPRFVRAKKRYSFLYDSRYRYDLTCVFSGHDQDSLNEPSFEIEIEYVHNNNNSSDIGEGGDRIDSGDSDREHLEPPPLEIAATLVEQGLQLIQILCPQFGIYQDLSVVYNGQ